MKTKYIYPAIFAHEAEGYSVVFPDVSAATSGLSLEEAMDNAEDALCLVLYDMEERGEAIPEASAIESIGTKEGQFTALIKCDTLEYRRYFSNKAVKKTLSIPAWLNTLAERENVNFSAVLQKALKAELNI